MNPAKTKPAAEQSESLRPSATWQFSLRNLFVLTTAASIGMAIGVHYGGFMVVAIAAGLILAGALLSADWLIRPENRRALAFVTASAWIVTGSGIAMLGVEAFVTTTTMGKQALGWPIGTVLVAAGLTCYAIAAWRWMKLARKSTKAARFDATNLEVIIQQ